VDTIPAGPFPRIDAHRCLCFPRRDFTLARLVPARTGRDDERSSKLSTGETSPNPAGHVPSGLDFFPRWSISV
jgi:hypothetical protein